MQRLKRQSGSGFTTTCGSDAGAWREGRGREAALGERAGAWHLKHVRWREGKDTTEVFAGRTLLETHAQPQDGVADRHIKLCTGTRGGTCWWELRVTQEGCWALASPAWRCLPVRNAHGSLMTRNIDSGDSFSPLMSS